MQHKLQHPLEPLSTRVTLCNDCCERCLSSSGRWPYNGGVSSGGATPLGEVSRRGMSELF
jgi:hypothetical protein